MQTSQVHSVSQWPRIEALLMALAGALVAVGQPMRDLVEAALDQKVTQRIEISERPIRAALTELEQRTGLRFALHEKALEWMPAGDETRIALVVQDVSVREALRRIFDGLGLTLRVENDKVLVEPSPMLDRLGRRLTVQEVQVLQALAARPWSELKADDVEVEFRLPKEAQPQVTFEKAMREGPPAAALARLEEVTQRLGWLWVLHGRTLVIYSPADDIQQRLDRPLDLSYRGVPLDELLVDLGRRVGVTVHFEPGVLGRVAARDRRVDLVQRQITARQALELIVGRTGLAYDVVDDGLVVGAGQAVEQPAGRIVAVLRIPVGDEGVTIDFLIRDTELPPEFRQLYQQKLPQVIELLRKQAGQ
jgi:G:T-mismatch repair DNA endonuclease (very short patch repair protein)